MGLVLLAQLVERPVEARQVVGSSPALDTLAEFRTVRIQAATLKPSSSTLDFVSDGSAQWWASGLESRARCKPEGSTPLLSALEDTRPVRNLTANEVGRQPTGFDSQVFRLWGSSTMEVHQFCKLAVEGSSPSFSTMTPPTGR